MLGYICYEVFGTFEQFGDIEPQSSEIMTSHKKEIILSFKI